MHGPVILCDLERSGERIVCRRCGWATPWLGTMVMAPRCRVIDLRRLGRCTHLGASIGERECRTCAGSVRVKLFECGHPEHAQTSLAFCQQHCPHFEAAAGVVIRAKLPLVFQHGLGDAVQFTIVLRHLAQRWPDVRPLIHCRPEHAAAFRLHAKAVPVAGVKAPGQLIYWPEPHQVYADSPSTKAEQCLRDVFGIQPDPELCRYAMQATPVETAAAAELRDQLGPFAFIHYRGASSRAWKNLDEAAMRRLVAFLVQRKITPLVLDLDRQSTLPANSGAVFLRCEDPIWRNDCNTAGQLLAIAAAAVVCVGIDSGPGHVMGASGTPAVISWTRNHPLHYYGLCENVTHLVPMNHGELLHNTAGRGAGLEFFAANYDARDYRDFAGSLVRAVEEKLQPPGADLMAAGDHWIRRQYRAADAEIVRDVYGEDTYQLGKLETPGGKVEFIVDVGAHVGAFAKLAAERFPFARILCVEANRGNTAALLRNLAELPLLPRGRGGIRAEAVHAACTYDAAAWLFSTVFPGTVTTGGSFTSTDPAAAAGDSRYQPIGHVPTITLDELLRLHRWQRIDVLKLDAEGAELSILEHAPLDALRIIVGEYHDAAAFAALIDRRFPPDTWRVQLRPTSPTMGLFTISRTQGLRQHATRAEPRGG